MASLESRQAGCGLAASPEPRHQPSGMNETIAALVRRHDPDRFLTALFAPPDRRDALLVLYAFNHELARAREVASEPTLALIRLQWWREVIEGAPRRHEVATPLSEAIQARQLDPACLLPLIEAREAEAYGDFPTQGEWIAWLQAGAGGLSVAAASALGATEPEHFRPFGTAYGIAGLLRATAALTAQGRCLLPHDLLARHGLVPEGFVQEDPDAPAVQAVLRDVAGIGQSFLAETRGATRPRPGLAAALPAVLARRDLARWPVVAVPRGLGDRLAVTWSGLTGHV